MNELLKMLYKSWRYDFEYLEELHAFKCPCGRVLTLVEIAYYIPAECPQCGNKYRVEFIDQVLQIIKKLEGEQK